MISKQTTLKSTSYQKARLQVVGYRAIQSRVNELLNQYSLNTSQWIILGWLYDNPAGMRMTELADILDVEVSLITALVRPLQSDRYIQLSADQSDRRAKIAILSDKGVKLVTEIEPAMNRRLAIFDNSIKRGEMELYFNALQQFIYANDRSHE